MYSPRRGSRCSLLSDVCRCFRCNGGGGGSARGELPHSPRRKAHTLAGAGGSSEESSRARRRRRFRPRRARSLVGCSGVPPEESSRAHRRRRCFQPTRALTLGGVGRCAAAAARSSLAAPPHSVLTSRRILTATMEVLLLHDGSAVASS